MVDISAGGPNLRWVPLSRPLFADLRSVYYRSSTLGLADPLIQIGVGVQTYDCGPVHRISPPPVSQGAPKQVEKKVNMHVRAHPIYKKRII